MQLLKKVGIYSISKYLELGGVAIVMLHFASAIGPTEFGKVAPAFLAITYSAFVVMGVNAAYVKYYSIEKSYRVKEFLSTYCYLLNIAGGGVAFILVFLLMDESYNLWVAGICSLNLIRGAIQSILRASFNVNRIAVFNLSFATLYFALYFVFFRLNFGSIDSFEFFFIWFLSLLLVSVSGTFFLIKSSLIGFLSYSRFIVYIKKFAPELFKNGMLQMALTVSSIVYISTDRIFLIMFDVSNYKVGLYQFSETVSNMFYMGSGAILYMLSPYFFKKLYERKIDANVFLKKGCLIFLLWLLVMLIFLMVCVVSIKIFLPEYEDAFPSLFLLSFLKYSVLLMFLPSTLLITYHKEIKLLKSYASLLPLLLIGQLAFCYFFIDYYYLLPIVGIACIAVVLFRTIKYGFRFLDFDKHKVLLSK